jgi:hypothetical protein
MAIPFREDEDVDHLGLAAFLRIVPSGDRDGFLGALFLINARGEPGEFTYNRLDVVQRFLWRADDLRRHVTRRLATSLFAACPRIPSVILVLADEVPAELFTEDVRVDVPTVRVAEQSAVVGQSAAEARDVVEGDIPLQIFWHGLDPEGDGVARSVVQRLAAAGLLVEPFERAVTGLREVYGVVGVDNGVVDGSAAG